MQRHALVNRSMVNGVRRFTKQRRWHQRRGRVVYASRESDASRRRRDLENRMRELAENDVALSEEELRKLWNEMQDVMRQEADEHPEEKTEAKKNMQRFLEMLFRELSSTGEGNSPTE